MIPRATLRLVHSTSSRSLPQTLRPCLPGAATATAMGRPLDSATLEPSATPAPDFLAAPASSCATAGGHLAGLGSTAETAAGSSLLPGRILGGAQLPAGGAVHETLASPGARWYSSGNPGNPGPAFGEPLPPLFSQRLYHADGYTAPMAPWQADGAPWAGHSYAFSTSLPELRQLVVTAAGPDRPGLVSNLTKRVLESGGNVEESRMARLAGEFSVIMVVSVDASVPRISEELRQRLLEVEGMQVTTRWAREGPKAEQRARLKFRRIFLKGADNPGLVYNVAEYLAANKINVENLETATEEAPFGGTTLFTMEGVIAMPLDMPTQSLGRSLDVLQNSLGVVIELRNMDPLKKAEDMRRFMEQVESVGGASRYSVLADREQAVGGDKLI